MILITGGTGYIGSHTCVELLEVGYEVAIIDNLSNSSPKVLDRITQITGKTVHFYQGDVRNQQDLETIFSQHTIEGVIHFAGLKAVGESVQQPLNYYENNVGGTITLCQVMEKFNCRKLVFSSTATVYGDPSIVPVPEDAPLKPENPYARSKLMVEQCLTDLYKANPNWSIALLRYFNPIGAHSSGLIGEHPNGIPNNLMPYIAQVAIGKRDYLNIFGDDYDTPDGTGVRDYIHVVDLAKGHIKAVEAFRNPQVLTLNLGTGIGFSVLEMVQAFERASNRIIPYRFIGRRPGDIGTCYSDTALAERILNWKAHYGVDQMCADTWHWQNMNPSGYN